MAIAPRFEKTASGSDIEYYDLPLEEAWLEDFLRYVFETHWEGIIFGPIIEGAAFEMRCPNAPTSITLFDGYLTVHFGSGHFHLCIGENMGSAQRPTPEAIRKERKVTIARIFRRFDKDGFGISWGLEMFNGKNTPMMSIFFPNPFLTDDDGIAEYPDFSRLSVWEDIGQRFLGRALDDKDRGGKGYGNLQG